MGGRMPDPGDRTSANPDFLDRYAERLAAIADESDASDDPGEFDAAAESGEPVP